MTTQRIFFLRREFIRFLFLGGLAAAVNFFSRIALGHFMSYLESMIVSYLLGFGVAYFLFRHYAFPSTQNNYKRELFYFVMVNILGIIQTCLISIALFDYGLNFITSTLLREEVAHLIGIGVPAISSYFGHKYLTFK